MSDHIPPEIVTNILNHATDVKDLVRWRRVSKQWLSIIDSDDFIKRHLHRSKTTNSNLLFLHTFRSGTFFRSDHLAGRVNPLRLHTKNTDQVASTYLVGSCDGLICYWLSSSKSKPSRLLLLNPSTGERDEELITSNYGGLSDCLIGFGFGYDHLSDDYIAVRIISLLNHTTVVRYCAEIHCVRGRRCRNIVTDFCFMPDWDTNKGVFTHGGLHWIACHSGSLVVLDLGSDTFRELSQPNYVNGDQLWRTSVGVLDSCLCVCAVYPGVKVDIWLMAEYGEKGSWSRLYSFGFGWDVEILPTVVPVGRSRSNGGGRVVFLLDCRRLLCYDCDLGRVVEDSELNNFGPDVEVGVGFTLEAAFHCVESLVKVHASVDKTVVKDDVVEEVREELKEVVSPDETIEKDEVEEVRMQLRTKLRRKLKELRMRRL